MANQLTRRSDRWGKAQSKNDVVKAHLEQLQQHLTCRAFDTAGFSHVPDQL